MEIWQSAVKMLEDPVQREAIEKLYIDYVPDKGTVSFPAEKTGINNIDKEIYCLKKDGVQDAETETDLGWHITKTNRRQLIVVAHNVTKFKLTLRGKIGWENGVELLQKYGQVCYSSDRLQAMGICLTKERYEDLSGWLKKITASSYWLADKSKKDIAKPPYFSLPTGCFYGYGLYYVYNYRARENSLYYPRDKSYEDSLAIRPSAYLSLDTLLDMGDKYHDGSSPARAIKMRIGDLKEEQSLELERQHYKRYANGYPYSYSCSWESIKD